MPAILTFDEAVRQFGTELKQKLKAKAIAGDPEEQLRTPLDHFLRSAAVAIGASQVDIVGEVKMADVSSRPDFAVLIDEKLAGFVELKALGKGGDPRKYKGRDRDQFARLRMLPNVIYTDAQEWSLWQAGELVARVETFDDDVASAGESLTASSAIENLLYRFVSWEPQAPSGPQELATVSARLCRLLREEVRTELHSGNPALESTANDWRHLLFPAASNEQFADGYAQAVTFGLLIARAKGISLEQPTDAIAKALGSTNSLIGRALAILGDAAEKTGLEAAIATLKRVLSVVDWKRLERGNTETWLYFYEHFLQHYDPELRKQTGSYYTPPEVVKAMTAWTDQAVDSLIGYAGGLADDAVTLVDPAMGTGTFLLEVLRLVAERYESDYGNSGQGAVLTERLKKVIGFEIQLGPYAVAQLRLLAELAAYGSEATAGDLRTYVADTLSNPYQEDELMGQWYEPIAVSRKEANRVKREEHVLVVIGNPPYRERSKGKGGWIESGSDATISPFKDYKPPKSWGVGPHTKNLHNLYVYFWRWATWKVFDSVDYSQPGVVALITVAGFLDGDGFQKMRAKMREQATDIFVIDCSPEGHQPPVGSRIFQAVQQPVCIVLAVRRPNSEPSSSANVFVRTLTPGSRSEKFAELVGIRLDDEGWGLAADEPRAPFAAIGASSWTRMPHLDDLFDYDGSGVMPGRTWPIAVDAWTLKERWRALRQQPDLEQQRELFTEHKQDRQVDRILGDALPGYKARAVSVRDDGSPIEEPIRYAFRSLDRQWIIPDKRLLNRPNPTLWSSLSASQIYLTAPTAEPPRGGPAVTVAATPPDMDHYRGRGGRVYPLWADQGATKSNVRQDVIDQLSSVHGKSRSPEEVFAYLVGIASHGGYVDAFRAHLGTPGVRIPITAEADLFDEVVALGRRSIFAQTYGRRMKPDSATVSTLGLPRLPADRAPRTVAQKPIPSEPGDFPAELQYDPSAQVLRVGSGEIAPVTPEMRSYEISGVNVIDKWFSYRKADRTRPQIGERRISALMDIQPDHWMPEYTADLVDLLNVIGLLCDLEPAQVELLDRVMAGELVVDVRSRTEGSNGARSGRAATLSSAAEQFGQTEMFDLPES